MEIDQENLVVLKKAEEVVRLLKGKLRQVKCAGDRRVWLIFEKKNQDFDCRFDFNFNRKRDRVLKWELTRNGEWLKSSEIKNQKKVKEFLNS